MDDLLQRLLKKRSGYEEDLRWEKFLMDAYAGTGGFQGRVRMPYAGFWGAGSELYGRASAGAYESAAADESQIDTYLDRYPREETPKFQRRAAIANYPNPVEPVIDIKLSYLHRKPMTRAGVDQESVESFLKNADGHGTPWDSMLRDTIHVRAEVLGGCPVLFDAPAAPEGETVETKLRAQELGIAPRAIPLFGAQIYDWHFKDGALEWVKIGTFFEERVDALSDAVVVHSIAIWYRDRVETYELVTEKGKGQEQIRGGGPIVRPNPWGVVPLLVCVHKPAQLPLRGLSAIGAIAKLAKRLLNYLSELDEHLRSTTFALLQVPTNEPDKVGSVLGGSGNALPVKTDSNTEYKFISPDTSVPVVYEARIKATKDDIRQIARTEYGANDTKQVKSGTSRAFEFENMNRAIADTAGHFARFDQLALRLVALMEGASAAELEKILVTAPSKFDVEDLAQELEQALQAKTLGLGPTATAEMLKRFVRQLLPNLDPKILEKIDGEIDEAMLAEEQARAAAKELMDKALAGEGEDEEDPDADPDDPDATKVPPPDPKKPPPAKE